MNILEEYKKDIADKNFERSKYFEEFRKTIQSIVEERQREKNKEFIEFVKCSYRKGVYIYDRKNEDLIRRAIQDEKRR